MQELFAWSSLVSLLTLFLLELVLGIDNVIFVSIIMGRMPEEDRKRARALWMVFGITTRTLLLMGLGWLLGQKGNVLFTVFGKGFDLSSLVMIGGGLFLIVKTTKEIHHKLEDHPDLEAGAPKKKIPFYKYIVQIVLVDLVFSFDSVITATGIADLLPVMITAVSLAMVVMFFFSGKIAAFISRHPSLTMLALSFLVMVGLVLIVEGWDNEKAEALHLKNYVYFGMVFSFAVELLNMRSRKKTSFAEDRVRKAEEIDQ